MKDLELLELAAKAAGYEETNLAWDDCFQVRRPDRLWDSWNPLIDDGDALRLAVKLEIDISFGANYVIADGVQQPTLNNANDPCAAVRQAIVRAAAEIGQQL